MMENPGVPPHPNNSNQLGHALSWILAFLFLVFFIFFSINFSSNDPKFRVDSFSLSNFTLIGNDSSSAISMAAQVQLTARNPNRYVTLSFGRTDTNVYYRSSWRRSLGPTTVFPSFSLGRKSEAPLTASFAAVVETGGGDNGEVLRFDVRLLSSVRYEEEAVVGRRTNHVLKVFCDGLVVGIPSSNGRPGGLIGGAPRPCGVLVSRS